ncbi:MAG: hypothetical protein U0Q22_07565 [Acidimicrobiales bacterium]
MAPYVLLVVWLAFLAGWVLAIVEVARSDERDWAGIRPTREVWLWTVILCGFFSSIGYALTARRRVRANAARRRAATTTITTATTA